ncbi:class I SAM-dependent methyltransferase [Pseudodesulfovibrio sp.]|uniref:class I SAM-dependent methyltransferase n=1 Tax=Pseudodesulfovibrio sp. TaxID=2035812 RepID=UPI002621029A|nr:class I SAM-dependent methyltransferase [Pseudodesulfovibrio sp.]MDD3313838.1 class I SAM-dependent methyltransferase [Pseudodesulfovibrio sp.]
MGGSSIALANGLMSSRNLGGVIYAVDTWGGSPEHEDFDFIRDDAMYGMFLRNIREASADLLIRPVRAPSVEGAKRFLDNSLDILFVDGNHSYECCLEDLEAWYSKVKPGGTILGHDYYADTKNGVYRAAQEFAAKNALAVQEPEGLRFFILKKPQ